ncbi:MAG TPA: flagellar biosynthesis anti-sigma factor FlgM [Casimicrobiaceae bacterium]|jgi:negative regulator of flagellin synthesis FlgM|nr:flagellar biosynthesis anti-sigma factor FlgM [Casimicrobiaceae bacterium]
MKINHSTVSGQGSKPAVSSAGTAPLERPNAAPAKSSPEAGGGASVQLSALSKELAALESSLATGGAFDAGKVQEIKEAIRSGTLSVNAQVVAEKMLAGLQEMFAKVK